LPLAEASAARSSDDTWLTYLDPSYRERAIRIGHDEHGYEVLIKEFRRDGGSIKDQLNRRDKAFGDYRTRPS